MRELCFGLSAFCLFVLGDLNALLWKTKMLRPLFFFGCGLLAWATAAISMPLLPSAPAWRLALFGGIAACFFILLIYSLFFAIPFKETYISPAGLPKVCRTGMYGLCRHPGLLWFAGMYLFLYLALPSEQLLLAYLLFTGANYAYVVWQDLCLFPRVFADYGDYKLSVPFLIPNFRRG
ncbi:MAG TPA: hypothetical protein VN446_03095 [Candidatus Acidoferrum sp.]|nr:hypothetical protein [Candidatus Acidoferrum sp.]